MVLEKFIREMCHEEKGEVHYCFSYSDNPFPCPRTCSYAKARDLNENENPSQYD